MSPDIRSIPKILQFAFRGQGVVTAVIGAISTQLLKVAQTYPSVVAGLETVKIAKQALEGAEEVGPRVEARVAGPLAQEPGPTAVHRPVMLPVTDAQVLVKARVADAVAVAGHADRGPAVVLPLPSPIAAPARRRQKTLALRPGLPTLLPRRRAEVAATPLLPPLQPMGDGADGPRRRALVRALVAEVVGRRRLNVEAVQGEGPVLAVGRVMRVTQTVPKRGPALVLHLVGAPRHGVAAAVASILGQVPRLLIRGPHALPRAVEEQTPLLRLMHAPTLRLTTLPTPTAKTVRRHTLLSGQAKLGLLTRQAETVTHVPTVSIRRLEPVTKVGIRPIEVLAARTTRPTALVPPAAKQRQLQPEIAASPP